MKKVFLIGLVIVFGFQNIKTYAGSCPMKEQHGECEVVKVFTRCDLEKQSLRRKIAILEKRIKELEERKPEMKIKTKIVENIVYKEKIVEKKEIKHNIISLYMARDVKDSNVTNGSNNDVNTLQTAYEPGIKYQYQFSCGLTPEVGINVKGNPMFGLGFGF